jgi:hypothetical protein
MAREHWESKLTHPVVPADGPLKPMRTLIAVAEQFAENLPTEVQRRPHWSTAASLLVKAAKTGERGDLRALTNQLMRALDRERWSV